MKKKLLSDFDKKFYEYRQEGFQNADFSTISTTNTSSTITFFLTDFIELQIAPQTTKYYWEPFKTCQNLLQMRGK